MERNPYSESTRALFDVCMHAGRYGYRRIDLPYMRVDSARNYAVQSFLEATADDPRPDDVLVMLDNDHFHPQHIVAHLTSYDDPALLGVVGALTFRRSPPHDPMFYMAREENSRWYTMALDWEDGLYEVDLVSTAAIAIRRWVFEKLIAAGHRLFFKYDYPDDVDVRELPSEDVHFARICHDLGVRHYCDTTILSPHIRLDGVAREHWKRYLAEHPELRAQANERSVRMGVIEHAEST
jgi:hypothetical protein